MYQKSNFTVATSFNPVPSLAQATSIHFQHLHVPFQSQPTLTDAAANDSNKSHSPPIMPRFTDSPTVLHPHWDNQLPLNANKRTDKRNAICACDCIFPNYFYTYIPGVTFSHQPDSAFVCCLCPETVSCKSLLCCSGLCHEVVYTGSQVQSKWKCWRSKFWREHCTARISNQIECSDAFWFFPHSENHDDRTDTLLKLKRELEFWRLETLQIW